MALLSWEVKQIIPSWEWGLRVRSVGVENSRGEGRPGEYRPSVLRKLRLERTDSRREEGFEVEGAVTAGELAC